MNGNLARLREITAELAFPPPCGGRGASEMTEYEMDEGTSLSWGLLSERAISAAKWFSSKGTVFPRHAHAQREWLVVYRGRMELHLHESGEVFHLGPGDFRFIPCDTPHSATFPSDCWYLAITIPSSEEWPKEEVG